jgi:hypothetical protein
MAGSPAATPSPAPLTPDRISWGAFARPAPPPGAARQHSFRPLSPPPPSSSNPSERAWRQQQQQRQNGGAAGKSPAASEATATEAARTTTSSRDDVSISNASELEVTEWIIQDEPGVYITVRELADGSRELRRVRFRSCPVQNIIATPSVTLQWLVTDRCYDERAKSVLHLQPREVCRAECEAVVGGEQGEDTGSVPLKQQRLNSVLQNLVICC